jgi:hypothetical protein
VINAAVSKATRSIPPRDKDWWIIMPAFDYLRNTEISRWTNLIGL